MKKTFKVACIGLALALAFSTAACSDSGKIVKSAEELKEYLDSQPANSPDKPIKVAINAKNLVLWNISDTIKSSGKYVSIDLSGSPITTIPNFAFCDEDTKEGCTGLIGITLPNSVTGIGDYAFAGCSGLNSLAIPKNVHTIGTLAFIGCTSLNSLTIPDRVVIIYDGAFAYCTSLTSVTIPKSVYEIWDGAFYECTSLTSVTFEGMITNFLYDDSFPGDLRAKYKAARGGIGTYKRTSGKSETWTKQ